MTSRERIKETFEFKMPDRLGMCDDITDNAMRKWEKDGDIRGAIIPQEFFGFDIRSFGFDQSFDIKGKSCLSLERVERPSIGESLKARYEKAEKEERFLALSCMEPFEHISGAVGRENLLMMMAGEADRAADLFLRSTEETLGMCQLMMDKGYHFDGAWLWGDLGYQNGLLFSTDYYNAFLLSLHKEFCGFFEKKGMPVIFHSDGNIEELIPHLIEAGVRAIEPLECNTGMDIAGLKREYGKDLVFFGGIDESSFQDAEKAEKEIRTKFKYLMKGGGYIYRADSPILENCRFKNYSRVIELVKEYGAY